MEIGVRLSMRTVYKQEITGFLIMMVSNVLASVIYWKGKIKHTVTKLAQAPVYWNSPVNALSDEKLTQLVLFSEPASHAFNLSN